MGRELTINLDVMKVEDLMMSLGTNAMLPVKLLETEGGELLAPMEMLLDLGVDYRW